MATKASLKQPNAHGFAGITIYRNTGKTEGKAAFFFACSDASSSDSSYV
jgi:hypothetical protein